jgi:hypothetical protein
MADPYTFIHTYITNSALRHEDIWGSGCIDPHFLDLGTSWRWVVSFTPWPLYPQGKRPRYPLDRRLGEPQNSLEDVEKWKLLPPPGLELELLGCPACSQLLYRLRCPGYLLTRDYFPNSARIMTGFPLPSWSQKLPSAEERCILVNMFTFRRLPFSAMWHCKSGGSLQVFKRNVLLLSAG